VLPGLLVVGLGATFFITSSLLAWSIKKNHKNLQLVIRHNPRGGQRKKYQK